MNNTINQPANVGKKLETRQGYFVKVLYNGKYYFFFTGKDFKKINVWNRTLITGDFPSFWKYNELRNKSKLSETNLSENELAQACRLAKFLSYDPLFGLHRSEKEAILAILNQKAKQIQLPGKTEQKEKAPSPEKPTQQQKVAPPPLKKKEKAKVVIMNSLSQLEKLKDRFSETVAVAN